MNNRGRRITIHDYPEHLNPFYENYSGNREKAGTSKYGTWGANTRCKLRQAVLDSTWMDALNLSPAKNKVTKKFFSFKTRTVDKFQRSRSKSNAFEHTLQRPERRDNKSQRSPLGNALIVTSTPVKSEANVWRKSAAITPEDDDSEVDFKYISQGAKPKLRKKRAAPVPPSSALNPDTGDLSVDSDILTISRVYESHQSFERDSGKGERLSPEPSTSHKERLEENRSSEINNCSSHTLKPLIEQPNIATLVSNNLTL